MGKDNYQRFYLIALFALIAALHWSCKEDKGDKPVPDTDEKSIHINLAYLDFPAEGGMEEVDFSATTDWQVVNPADTWLQVTPTSGTSGQNLTLQLQTDKNEDSAERQAKIIVRSTAGNSADTLTVRQAGTTRYVDIDWENNATLTQFDLNSGNVCFTYSGTVPDFTPEVSTIVVPTDSLSYIRVVKSATVSGNSVSLQTEEGNMTDLFMDQEFTISLEPAEELRSTRAGGISTVDHNGVIHPSKIEICTTDGQWQTLYSATETRASDPITGDKQFHIPPITPPNPLIYSDRTASVYWEKCVINSNLGGEFYFAFGGDYKVTEDGLQVPIGSLDKFRFTLNGNMFADFLLRYTTNGTHAINNLPVKWSVTLSKGFCDFAYTFLIGSIPLRINVKGDIEASANMYAEDKMSVSSGFNAGINVNAGMEYTNGSTTPIFSAEPSFNIYYPEVNLSGKANIEATVYPALNILLFNFVGPSLSVQPFIGYDGGVFTYKDNNTSENYLLKEDDLYFAVDPDLSLSLSWANISLSYPIYNKRAIKTSLYKSPAYVVLEAPVNKGEGQTYKTGEPIEVVFSVRSHDLFDIYNPVKNTYVFVETTNGYTDNKTYLTDENGLVTVTYTPTAEGSILEASIRGKDGEKIDTETFIPNLEKENIPSIIGKWTYESGASAYDTNIGGDASIRWKNILNINEDGTYNYIENPEKKIFNWVNINDTESPYRQLLIYSYCEGHYTYNEDTHTITLYPEKVIDETNENGIPQNNNSPFVYSLFGKAGSYYMQSNPPHTVLWIKFIDYNNFEHSVGFDIANDN